MVVTEHSPRTEDSVPSSQTPVTKDSPDGDFVSSKTNEGGISSTFVTTPEDSSAKVQDFASTSGTVVGKHSPVGEKYSILLSQTVSNVFSTSEPGCKSSSGNEFPAIVHDFVPVVELSDTGNSSTREGDFVSWAHMVAGPSFSVNEELLGAPFSISARDSPVTVQDESLVLLTLWSKDSSTTAEDFTTVSLIRSNEDCPGEVSFLLKVRQTEVQFSLVTNWPPTENSSMNAILFSLPQFFLCFVISPSSSRTGSSSFSKVLPDDRSFIMNSSRLTGPTKSWSSSGTLFGTTSGCLLLLVGDLRTAFFVCSNLPALRGDFPLSAWPPCKVWVETLDLWSTQQLLLSGSTASLFGFTEDSRSCHEVLGLGTRSVREFSKTSAILKLLPKQPQSNTRPPSSILPP